MTKKRISYGLIFFSLVLLFQPNILIVDFLPDFLACFLLAAFFARGEDSIPGFSEAKRSLSLLGVLGLLKFAGLALIVLVRSKNTSDYDILALVCTLFGAAEILLSVIAANRSFRALFHLGERTDASALLSYRGRDAERLRVLTIVFAAVKCAAYIFPQFFALSRVNENGTVNAVSDAYPAVLMISMLVALTFGIVWLVQMIGYVRSVKAEGKLDEAISSLSAEQAPDLTAERAAGRRLRGVFTFGILLSFLSPDLIFEDLNEINLLPHPLFAAALTALAFLIARASGAEKKLTLGVLSAGGCYLLFSAVCYALGCVFYPRYKYPALGLSEERFLRDMASGEAGKFYRSVEVFALLEALALCALAVLLGVLLLRLTKRNDYPKAKIWAYIGSLILLGGAKCAKVFLDGNVRLENLVEGDGTTAAVVTSPLPWFGTVVFVLTAVFILASILFWNDLKTELTDRNDL